MAKYCEIFWSFFKVGTFTLGGGYAMIPLMQRELVERHGWIEADEFADAVALCQAMPGVFAVNMATMIGNRLRGARGAAAAVIGNVAMPVAMILLLAIFFRTFRGNETVERIFRGLRPVVVALVAAPVFTLARSAGITLRNCWLPIAAAVAVWLLGVNPVFVVIGAAALGCALKGRRL